jgi:hypothetical protein
MNLSHPKLQQIIPFLDSVFPQQTSIPNSGLLIKYLQKNHKHPILGIISHHQNSGFPKHPTISHNFLPPKLPITVNIHLYMLFHGISIHFPLVSLQVITKLVDFPFRKRDFHPKILP